MEAKRFEQINAWQIVQRRACLKLLHPLALHAVYQCSYALPGIAVAMIGRMKTVSQFVPACAPVHGHKANECFLQAYCIETVICPLPRRHSDNSFLHRGVVQRVGTILFCIGRALEIRPNALHPAPVLCNQSPKNQPVRRYHPYSSPISAVVFIEALRTSLIAKPAQSFVAAAEAKSDDCRESMYT